MLPLRCHSTCISKDCLSVHILDESCLCRGHLSQGRALMAPYLPRNGASGSPYSEGGALYALGLIHANHGQDIRDFLLESLRGTQNEVCFCSSILWWLTTCSGCLNVMTVDTCKPTYEWLYIAISARTLFGSSNLGHIVRAAELGTEIAYVLTVHVSDVVCRLHSMGHALGWV